MRNLRRRYAKRKDLLKNTGVEERTKRRRKLFEIKA